MKSSVCVGQQDLNVTGSSCCAAHIRDLWVFGFVQGFFSPLRKNEKGRNAINHNDYVESLKSSASQESDRDGDLLICTELRGVSSGSTLTPFACVFFQKATEPSALSQTKCPPTDIREHFSFPPLLSPTQSCFSSQLHSSAMTHVSKNCIRSTLQLRFTFTLFSFPLCKAPPACDFNAAIVSAVFM